MEDLGIKNSGYSEGLAKSSNGRDKATALAGLASSFQDFLGKTGLKLDSSLNALTDSAGISAIAPGREAADYGDDPRPDYGSDNRDLGERRSERRDDEPRAESPRPSADDDSRPVHDDRMADTRENTETNASDDFRDSGNDKRDTAAEGAPRENDRSETASNEGSGDAEGNSNEGVGETGNSQSDSNANNGTNADANATPGEQAAVAQASAGAGNTGLMAAAAMLKGKAQTEQGPASETGKVNVAENLTVTGAASGKKGSNHGGQTGPQHSANMTGQVQGSANQQSQNADDGIVEVVNRAQQQAQLLAKNLNQNDRVQVNVSVADEGESLVSKPGSTLSNASTVAGANSTGQAKSSQNAASNQAGNSHNPNPMAAAGQAQVNTGQAQVQQTASASSQVQAAVQAGMDGKGAAGATQSGIHSGGSAGGGESVQSNTASGNGQIQQGEKPDQAARAQSQNANRPTQMGQSVVEQVSAKITKALQSGSDRINVQLKPAEMGRVEVKMELTHDGRVMAVVTADNKDTLDLLRRDSSELQRTLAEAGMDLDSGDLNFNLRGQENEMAEEQQSGDGLAGPGDDVAGDEADDAVDDGVMLAHESGLLANGRIDVRA